MVLVRVSAFSDAPPEGEVRVYDADGVSLCIANVSGELLAIDNICTHDGGTLGEGELDDAAVECPRHGGRFDLFSGRVLALPPVRPVNAYEVSVEGDAVRVRTGVAG
jgi:nitrite reductase/ring-hydroxylating ferredoxin subunit